MRWTEILRVTALVSVAALAGCIEEGPASPALSGGEDCADMKRQMDRMVGQGKANSEEYSELLNRYARLNCY